MLHNTNRTKCLIPYRLENADAITKKVFRNFLHPVTFALFFFHQPWRDFSVALPLCEPKRLCLDIDFTGFFCFVFLRVFLSQGLCVPIRLVRNDPKAPSEECYVVWRSPRRYMCFALFCAALGYGCSCFHTYMKRFSCSQAAVYCIRCTTLEGWHEELHRSDFHSKINRKYYHKILCIVYIFFFFWHFQIYT